LIDDLGIRKFIKMQSEEWKCNNCGELVCVHTSKCSYCGAVNAKYPINR
jgi:ribosomal protein L32